jgi:medium-chain acyl-[acyl-carrier-protein] hydrolase
VIKFYGNKISGVGKMRKTKLFCFPYAGGSSMVYTKWKKHLDNSIELKPIELAGRGKRFLQPFKYNMDDTVNDIYNIIKEEIDESPYSLLGHSMGSLIVYELNKKIKEAGLKAPVHAFFSGSKPPHMRDSKALYKLPDDEFKDEIFKMEGTPKELLENKELLEIFLPVLRADYTIVDTYKCNEECIKLNCDMSVLYGKKDDVTVDEIVAWKNYTNRDCKIYGFEGGHFFIHNNIENIVKIINNTLVQNI